MYKRNDHLTTTFPKVDESKQNYFQKRYDYINMNFGSNQNAMKNEFFKIRDNKNIKALLLDK